VDAREGSVRDYSKIPQQLEARFSELDEDSALRPTIINPGNAWQKRFQKSLLSAPENTSLGPAEQGRERQKAFDLLDALTKAGCLTVGSSLLGTLS
jgi:hypothetical protein